MFWIGTYSTTEKLRLLSNYQDSDYSLGVYADYHQVRTSSLNRWIKQFLTAGLAGLIRPEHNHRYTLQTKRSAVKAYLSGTLSGQAILNRYQIRSLSQLDLTSPDWICVSWPSLRPSFRKYRSSSAEVVHWKPAGIGRRLLGSDGKWLAPPPSWLGSRFAPGG